PALFVSDQRASPGEYREGVTDVFGASTRMPSRDRSCTDQLSVRRTGAEADCIAVHRGQRLPSFDNRGTIEWHPYLPRYRKIIYRRAATPRQYFSKHRLSVAGCERRFEP